MTQKQLDNKDNKEYNNLLLKIQNELIQETKKMYSSNIVEINPKYDKNGNITNVKEIKKNINNLKELIKNNWNKAYNNLEFYKKKQSEESYNFYKKIHHYFWLLFIAKKEWDNKIKLLEKKRGLNIKKIFNGKANNQIKKLNQQISNAVKNNATKKEIKKIVSTNFYNMGEKATYRILNDEMNTYREMFNIAGTDDLNIEKKWEYTYRSKFERSWHKAMNGQVADKDGFFKSPLGNKTKAPRLFGKASEDCSCKCEMEISYLDDIKYLDKQLKYYSKYEKKIGISLDDLKPDKEKVDNFMEKFNLKESERSKVETYQKIRDYRLEQRIKGNEYWLD